MSEEETDSRGQRDRATIDSESVTLACPQQPQYRCMTHDVPKDRFPSLKSILGSGRSRILVVTAGGREVCGKPDNLEHSACGQISTRHRGPRLASGRYHDLIGFTMSSIKNSPGLHFHRCSELLQHRVNASSALARSSRRVLADFSTDGALHCVVLSVLSFEKQRTEWYQTARFDDGRQGLLRERRAVPGRSAFEG
ncbi:hypothetical protein E4U59_005929 [Claviceps monticola]|nr:hypothetical protein E4U59_005929 [Claviceps monticola]